MTDKLGYLRQIRNAFQTAIALAEYEAGEKGTPSLALGHFKKVADASKEFDIYLKHVYGGQSDAHIARMEQSRIDDYSPAEAMRRAGRANLHRDSLPTRRKGGRSRELETDSESESESASVDEEGSDSENESESGAGDESESGSRSGGDDWRRERRGYADNDVEVRTSTGKGRR